MDIVIAVTVCCAIIGMGELVSYLTKAIVPSMAASLIIYLLLTWAGMTKGFPDTSGFNYLGELSMLFIVVHLGSSVVPTDFIKNIKTVIVTAAALVCGLIMVVGVGGLFFGFDTMLAGAGAACGGGALGGILAIQKLTDVGLVSLVAIPAIIIGVVDFYGQPIAAFMLRKYVGKLSKGDQYLLESVANKDASQEIRLTKHGIPYGSEDNPSTRFTAWIPKSLEEDGFVLFEMAAISLISYMLDIATGVNMCVYAFFLTVLGCYFGVLRMNLLDRCHSTGLVFVIFITWIFVGMNDLTPQGLLEGLAPSLAVLILATIGLACGGGFVGKLLGYDFWLSAACGMGLMFLNPGVMFVTDEVCKKNARNNQEAEFFKSKCAPSMYIASNIGYILGILVTVQCLIPLLGYSVQ